MIIDIHNHFYPQNLFKEIERQKFIKKNLWIEKDSFNRRIIVQKGTRVVTITEAMTNVNIRLEDMDNGEWVAQVPSMSATMVGYHVSQIYTTPAERLYSEFRDPQQTIAEFYRKRLGRPYTMAGGSLDRNDFLLNCFD